MREMLHILATVRNPELLEAALLVFRTLRVGFPTAPVMVWGNALQGPAERAVAAAAFTTGGRFTNLPKTVHDEWIEGLIYESVEPFWVCDTDICLWADLQHGHKFQKEGVALAGRFEPAFLEDWTGTVHVERLHTCLMYIDPARLRAAMRAWMARIPAPWGHSGQYPFVRQHFIPQRNGRPLFYDTCAGLWQAGIGTPFSKEQDAAFDHLHCATYADLIPTLEGLREGHQVIYRNHELARGIRKMQDSYYASHALPNGQKKRRTNHAIQSGGN